MSRAKPPKAEKAAISIVVPDSWAADVPHGNLKGDLVEGILRKLDARVGELEKDLGRGSSNEDGVDEHLKDLSAEVAALEYDMRSIKRTLTEEVLGELAKTTELASRLESVSQGVMADNARRLDALESGQVNRAINEQVKEFATKQPHSCPPHKGGRVEYTSLKEQKPLGHGEPRRDMAGEQAFGRFAALVLSCQWDEPEDRGYDRWFNFTEEALTSPSPITMDRAFNWLVRFGIAVPEGESLSSLTISQCDTIGQLATLAERLRTAYRLMHPGDA